MLTSCCPRLSSPPSSRLAKIHNCSFGSFLVVYVSNSVLDAIISAQVGCEQSGLCDDVTLRGDSEEEEEDEDIRALQEEIRWGRSWQ